MAICVLDPTSEEAVATSPRAPRLSSLAGRTVGLLDNDKLRVHELLNDLETLLRTEHGVAVWALCLSGGAYGSPSHGRRTSRHGSRP
jgi:hypothetical protein